MQTDVIVFPRAQQAALTTQQIAEPGPGRIRVEATYSLISTGTELICYHGSPDADTHWAAYAAYPHYPGYSLAGIVSAVGEGVEGFSVGQRVSTTASHRRHAVCTEAQVWGRHVPDQLSDQEAAWAALAVITQTGVRMAEHALGDTAVVVGLGPLGQLVVQYLRVQGLRRILVVDPVAARLQIALAQGATAALAGSAAGADAFVREHNEGGLADVVYDVTGHWAVLPQGLRLARDHGKLILLGDSPHPSRQHLTSDVLSRQVRIIGSRSSLLPPQHSAWTPQRMTDLFFDYLVQGRMRVSDLITDVHRPEEAAQVYQSLSAKRTDTMGVLFDWKQR